MYLLGIDLGSTNLKVSVYNFKGRVINFFSCPTPIHYDGNSDRFYYNPIELWKVTCRGIQYVLSKIKNPRSIVSVAVASPGETIIPVGKKGKAIGNAFPWFDDRTKELGEWWHEFFKRDEIFKITGSPPQYKFSLYHLLWMKKYRHYVFANTNIWMSLSDYISFQLSGVPVMNYSIASTTMMLDIKQLKWSEKILLAAGIEPKTLPPLVNSGQPLGLVCNKAVKESGLSSKTIVVAGGHDHICGSLACNVYREGQVLDSTGTGKATIMPLKNLILNKKAIESGFDQRCNVIKEMYYLAGSNPNGGSVIDWLVKELSSHREEKKYMERSEIFKYITQKASMAPAGCRGVFFLPNLFGSSLVNSQKNARAGFIGIRYFHKRNELLRAVFEGMGYELRSVIDSIESLTGISISKVVAIGGCTQNKFLMQLGADTSGRTIEIPDLHEAVGLGAAILGGIAAGVYKDEEEAGNKVYRIKYKIKPDRDNSELYNYLYKKIYIKLNQCLKDINNEISEIKGL